MPGGAALVDSGLEEHVKRGLTSLKIEPTQAAVDKLVRHDIRVSLFIDAWSVTSACC